MSFLWLFKTKTLTNRIFTVLWSIRLCFWWCNMYACLPPTQDKAIDCFWLRMFEPLNINIWVIPEKILKNKKSNANEVEWNNCQPTNKTLNIPIARLVPHCEPAWGWPGYVWRGESPIQWMIMLEGSTIGAVNKLYQPSPYLQLMVSKYVVLMQNSNKEAWNSNS